MTNHESRITVGVLALQGDFAEHVSVLDQLKVRTHYAKATRVKSIEVRSAKDLETCDALVLPGGESTVMMKLLCQTGLDQEIIKRVQSGMPVFGTCAGAILLSDSHLDLLDITIDRNAYGSQLQSFSDQITIEDIGTIDAIFIRAPIIIRSGEHVSVLATLKEHPVLVRQGNILAATFHPEIQSDTAIHAAFLNWGMRSV